MGKTRLSIEIARTQLDQFTDGICFLPLASISENGSAHNNNLLVGPLADALKITFHSEATPEQQMLDYLQRQEMLLVLDNFEHLLETAVFLSDILSHAPDVKILVTSREQLNLHEEWLFALQGLQFQTKTPFTHRKDIGNAVQLFEQRAKQVKPSFDLQSEYTAILKICQLVEGMPLGLELAASWVRHLSCEEIAREIKSELDFLTTQMRNLPDRQRSIRAVFGYSWDRLNSKEQDVLQKLSVFRGGFERKAAKAVADASLPLLAELVGKSLLSVGENGRYQFHELLRQFLAEKLLQQPDAGEAAYEQHSIYFLTLLADQEEKVYSTAFDAVKNEIIVDFDNIRTAILRSATQPQQLNSSILIVLIRFFYEQSWHFEGLTIFRQMASYLKPDCINQTPAKSSHAISTPCYHWLFCHVSASFFGVMLGHQEETNLQECARWLPTAKSDIAYWLNGFYFTVMAMQMS